MSAAVLASVGVCLMRLQLPGWRLAFDLFVQLRGPAFASALWFFAVWLVIAECHAVLHEGAHAVTGLSLGLPVTSITAAGVRLYRHTRRDRRWHLGVREPEIPFLGGLTYVEHQAGSTVRLIATTAAGPAMSLLLSIGLLVAAISLSGRAYGDPLRVAVTLALVHCAWNALHNSVPMLFGVPKRAGIFAKKTDGAVLAELFSLHRFLKDHPAAARLRDWAVSGRRLRDCPVTVDEAAEAIPEDLSRHSEFLIIALIRCLDARAFPQARRLIDRGVEEHEVLTDWARSDVLVQGTCLYALVLGDLTRARELLALAKEHEVGPKYARIAETAVLFAEGKREQALHELEQFLDDATRARWPHLVLAGNEWSIDLIAPGRVDVLKTQSPFAPPPVDAAA